MAGLSFVYAVCQEPTLRDKRILLVDSDTKTQNDRTWAFWEIGTGRFDPLLYRQWEMVQVRHPDQSKIRVPMAPYTYKLIRGADFYAHVRSFLTDHPQVTWIQGEITSCGADESSAWLSTSTQQFKGKILVDSIYRPRFDQPYRNHLWQHFKGYFLEMDHPIFDPNLPDIMDFSVPQVDGECTFLYVLPFSTTRALVELTFFSEPILSPERYTALLRDLIAQKWPGVGYQIEEEEFGIIPMTDGSFQEIVSKRHVRIGTAGGYTQPATGFTFALTQERVGELVQTLVQGKFPTSTLTMPRKRMEVYAAILLQVLRDKLYEAHYFFPTLFQKNPPQRVFGFLSGHTTIWDEIRVMQSAPWVPFIRASWRVFKNRMKEKFT